MQSRPGLFRISSAVLLTVLVLHLASCGTLLYPERRGQAGGRIDPGVAILDGVGLILFVIPGAVAFAVDFITGAIYLPAGKKRSAISDEDETVQVVRVDPDKLTQQSIEEIVRRETGLTVRLDDKDVRGYEVEGPGQIGTRLAGLSKQCFLEYCSTAE